MEDREGERRRASMSKTQSPVGNGDLLLSARVSSLATLLTRKQFRVAEPFNATAPRCDRDSCDFANRPTRTGTFVRTIANARKSHTETFTLFAREVTSKPTTRHRDPRAIIDPTSSNRLFPHYIRFSTFSPFSSLSFFSETARVGFDEQSAGRCCCHIRQDNDEAVNLLKGGNKGRHAKTKCPTTIEAADDKRLLPRRASHNCVNDAMR